MTYDLSPYTQSSGAIVFGLWNIMPTSQGSYRLELRDAANNVIAPAFGWNLIGNDANTAPFMESQERIRWFWTIPPANSSRPQNRKTPTRIRLLESDSGKDQDDYTDGNSF